MIFIDCLNHNCNLFLVFAKRELHGHMNPLLLAEMFWAVSYIEVNISDDNAFIVFVYMRESTR